MWGSDIKKNRGDLKRLTPSPAVEKMGLKDLGKRGAVLKAISSSYAGLLQNIERGYIAGQ